MNRIPGLGETAIYYTTVLSANSVLPAFLQSTIRLREKGKLIDVVINALPSAAVPEATMIKLTLLIPAKPILTLTYPPPPQSARCHSWWILVAADRRLRPARLAA